MVSPVALARLGGEWVGYPESVLLLAVLSLAWIGTGLLFFGSLIAYRRRRTRKYALVTAAVGALVVRSVVGVGTVLGVVPMPVHHLVAHGLDFTIAALILSAIYRSSPGSSATRVE